ncbi:Helix-turn-helix protein [Burkholderia dolosa AU0158]|nr:Helix-turn-helix protein [Burkholderia dolosa AU0158]
MRHLLTSETNRNRTPRGRRAAACRPHASRTPAVHAGRRRCARCRLGVRAFGAIIASPSFRRRAARRHRLMRPPRLDQLDDLDRQLVALLQANARASVADLARQLDVARTTIVARIARLERTNVIAGYSVRLGQDVLDASIYAYVGIILTPKFGKDVLRKLDRMPEVQLLCAVSGEYDYVAWLRADSPERLNDLLDQIGTLEGVERTTTSIILSRKIDRGTIGG